MWQKILIALSSFALGAVGGAWGYSIWSQKPEPAVVIAPKAEVATARAVTPAPEAAKAGGTRFSYEYVAPHNAELLPLYQRARERDLLRKLAEIHAIDGLLMLPTPLRYVMAECKDVNAFYAPGSGEIVLCYETIQVLLKQGETVAKTSQMGADFPQQYLQANLRFIALHETGHALIDLLGLPITGREEDAVDQLATTLMQKFASADESPQQVVENLRMAGTWFLARSQGQYNLDAYADEHSLGEQRYFNLQCLIYGRDPARYLGIVTAGDLPEARAQRCPEEARRVSRSWLRLLLPYVAPKFEMTEEKANRFFEQKERARARNADSTYVR